MIKNVFYAKWGAASIISTVTGSLMNALAVVSNGMMMPVFLGRLYPYAFEMDSRHIVMTPEAHLKFLCDYIPIGKYAIASPGDFVSLAGVLSLAVCALIVLGASADRLIERFFTEG